MTYRPLLAVAAVVVLGASAALAARPAKPRQDALPFKEFMGHVVQRNAEQLWAWSAEEVDAQGSHSSRPANEQDWENAESDALTLVELTYLLEGPTYRWPATGWSQYVGRARAAASASAKAAEQHDYAGLQKAADQLNAACVACHLHFVPALESGPPAAAAAPVVGAN